MDDEFFASVLKKWADSSQDVLVLKKRLGEVEQERNDFRRRVDEFKAKENQRPVRTRSLSSHNCGDVEILDLDDVGNKLEKARSEYQRRLKELSDACSREETQKREIEKLKEELSQLQAQVQSSRTQHTQVSSQLWSLQNEKQTLTKMVSDLTARLGQAEKAKSELEITSLDIPNMNTQQVMKLQEQMTSLETQLQELQALSENLEAENTTLRGDLTVTREALQKTKDSNKGLRATIAQLSRLARNVAGASDATSTLHESPSVRTSMEVSRDPGPLTIIESIPTPKPEPKVEVDLSFNDVTIVADHSGSLTPISSHRREALASLPVVIPDIDINDEDNKFTRALTSAAVTQSIQSQAIPAISSGIHPAKGWNIEEYLCPKLDHNPWCPSVPGQHGYMFVGLGKEKYKFTTPQLRNLFVGLPKRTHKDERYFRYLGVYRVTRAASLSITEWGTLQDVVKQNYTQATKDKDRDSRTKEDISAAYDSGELSVPCVKLECVDFDGELYAGLLAFRTRQNSAGKGATKRGRGDANEGNVRLIRSRRATSKRAPQ